MILQNMTPKEKVAQMDKLSPFVISATRSLAESKFKAFKRASRFPAYLFVEKEFKGLGRWTLVVECDSKGDACKGRYSAMAFQTFHVSRSKNPTNNGIGIYLYHHQTQTGAWCMEFPPHYFNRVRQRLIEPKGIAQPDFNGLLREVLRLHHHCMNVINEGTVIRKGEDGLYDVVKTAENTRMEGYDNFAAYHDCGISLGLSADRRYFLYTTFVSNDLLRKGQSEMQRQQVKDARNHEVRIRDDKQSAFAKEEIVENVDF